MSDFIICTRDFSGLGFAVKLQDEGHDVLVAFEPDPDMDDDKREAYELVGSGIVKRSPMKEAFDRRAKLRDCAWIFDSNYLWEYADKLRKEGFKVFGASEWTSKMEHDRAFGTAIAKQAGLDLPETKEFSDVGEAIAFLESNDERAYVCKPNDAESHLTYVPQMEVAKDANRELRQYLSSMGEGQEFILQEKIKGVEINCECFFFNGKPYFAHANFECKRKNSGDKGTLTGCAQDVDFIVPMDCELVQKTVAKMYPTYAKQRFTGFGDLNCIIADNKVYFIEWCLRFAFNGHPNLFWNLAISPIGELFEAMMDGKIDNFYRHFRKGFGASILMYIDHPQTGFPIYIAPEMRNKFYCYEFYQDEEVEKPESDFRLAGFSNEVGIIMGFGYTMKDAAKQALDNALKVNYPSATNREDLNEEGYESSPVKRYQAIEAMALL